MNLSANLVAVPLERQAHASEISAILTEVLVEPVRILESDSERIVILFSRIAYVIDKEDKTIEVTLIRGNSLVQSDLTIEESEFNLPISLHKLKGVRRVLTRAVFETYVERIAAVAGAALADFRCHARVLCSDSTIVGTKVSSAKVECFLKVKEVPARTLHEVISALNDAMQIEPRTAELARSIWDTHTRERLTTTYNILVAEAILNELPDPSLKTTLSRHVLSYALQCGSDVSLETVKRFRSELKERGVSTCGWRLLIASDIEYWNQVFARGYDLKKLAVVLLLGQSRALPELPSINVCKRIFSALEDTHDSDYSQVRPQVWRKIETVSSGQKNVTRIRNQIGLVLTWSAALHKSAPKSIWSASWDTWVSHSVRWAKKVKLPGDVPEWRLVIEEMQVGSLNLIGLTNAEQIVRLGTIMENCLISWEGLNPEKRLLYFASTENQIAAISLFRKHKCASWSVDQVYGPQNSKAHRAFHRGAQELADHINAIEFT